jgi:hypothetical protein
MMIQSDRFSTRQSPRGPLAAHCRLLSFVYVAAMTEEEDAMNDTH